MTDLNEFNALSDDIERNNINKLKELFPEIITEDKIDFEKFRMLFGDEIDSSQEKYSFTWNGKARTIKSSQQPSTGTLRPLRNKSIKWGETNNIYLEGDNLEVLKLLQKSYSNRIKLIYMDPPYNTGTDIIYPNDFSSDLNEYLNFTNQKDNNGTKFKTNTESSGRYHTEWVDMMYSRIKLTKNLLADDGAFVISIDHNELANLIKISDEIFGENNRIAIITVIHKPEGRNQARYFGTSNEFLLVYAKNQPKFDLRSVAVDEDEVKKYDKTDDKGLYRLKNFIRLSDGKYATRESKPNFWYPLYIDIDTKKVSVTELNNSVAVYPVTDGGIERTWKTTKSTTEDRINKGDIVAVEKDGKYIIYEKLRESQVFKTHWINKKYHAYHYGTKLLDDLLGFKSFDFPKSLHLMKDIVKMFTEKDDIILDLFSGSATTAHSVMLQNAEDNMNRKFIMTQIPEPITQENPSYKHGFRRITDIGQKRIELAGNQLLKTNPDLHNKLDTGYKVYKLDTSNIKKWNSDVDNLENTLVSMKETFVEERTHEDIVYEILLKLGLDLNTPFENNTVATNEIYDVAHGNIYIVLGDNITKDVATFISNKQKDYQNENPSVVFDDYGFINDNEKLNTIEILKNNGFNEEQLMSI